MEKVKFDTTKAHQLYITPNGDNAPGTTTILSIIEKPALHHWYYNCGIEGDDPFKKSKKAADIGIIAHFLIECHLRGQEPDTSDFAPADLSKAENAVIKFMSWWDTGKFTVIDCERQLVAVREPLFGGTLDILARDADNKVVLIDLKTSKAIYDDYWRQVAAYGELYEQNRESNDAISRYIICRIGKESTDADWEVQERADIKLYLLTFLKCLDLWFAMKAEKEKSK